MRHFHNQGLIELKTCMPFLFLICDSYESSPTQRMPSTLDALFETDDTCLSYFNLVVYVITR